MYLLISGLSSTALPDIALAQQTSTQTPPLKQLSIEELLEIDVTLPLRRDEPVREAAAAISVLTSEDMRRSAAVSLPDVLRHVPGLFMGRFAANSWVITARGFASTSSNKLLVMIDGRSVYSPLFSGVFWDQQDALLHDLDRVEIIRGPGASLWGSNAVNGVINVVSKPASDTQGLVMSIGGGTEEQVHGSVRYGGSAGDGYFRVYGKYFDRDAAHLDNGGDAGDWQRLALGGFRADFGDRARSFTLQGDAHTTSSGFLGRDDIQGRGVNLLGRWARQLSPSSTLQIQTYADHFYRSVPQQFRESRNTFDLDVQHRFTAGGRHSLSWGGGFRYSADDTTPTALLFFIPEDRATTLVGAFLQDEIALSSTVSVIGGLKIERNDYTGIELQPTGRIRWLPRPNHTLWGAVSRGIRMPTRLDTDVRVTQNGVVIATGNPDFRSESVVTTEAGYRGSLGAKLAWDVAVFMQRYDDIRTQELAFPVVVGNGLNVASEGITVAGTVQPIPTLRLTGSYGYLHYEPTLDADSRDVFGGRNETIDPHHQALALARIDLPRNFELDLSMRYISELPNPGTPAYAEAGFRLGWRVARRLELALIGRDLLHADHLEFVSPTSAQRTRLERAVFTRATVAF